MTTPRSNPETPKPQRTNTRRRLSLTTSPSSPACKPRRHNNEKDKSKWSIPTLTKPTVIIGSSNISNIPFLHPDTQAESYPGARIQHINTLLSKITPTTIPKNVLFHVGLNNKQESGESIHRRMLELLKLAKSKFPSATLYATQIPSSKELQLAEPHLVNNLQKFNSLLYHKPSTNAHTIPRFNGVVNVISDNIHWMSPTAKNLLNFLFSTIFDMGGLIQN
ncbi:hypothetical protein LOTGIDRAFT_175223 [Lottia gigantea]|uniref:SGNH hydrolase-type esterase domain-containing protein n=1 Tax=Lottia gigantea TaxID=225164 RepID=V4AE98_LOTGI|nr:hypothetical protein LOTGIDRAFT_175223 [Lottia gigantea]ESO95212.1 hypothetical protein LOTGIDRAFT_175223 [Lottia gigantea]